MPKPLALCIEDVDALSQGERYLRCVALVGRQPGLRLGAAGVVEWLAEQAVAAELWVSGDDQLILFRPSGAAPVQLSRAGRSLDVPFDKPVVARGGDVVAVGERRLRLHVHGPASTIAAPAPLPERKATGAARVAAVLAMGAAVAGCDRIHVRETPPDVPAPPRDGAPPEIEPLQPSATATATATATLSQSATVTPTAAPSAATKPVPTQTSSGRVPPEPPEIEVREMPPFEE